MLSEFTVQTKWGEKRIKVVCGDLLDLPAPVDLLVCSAFWRDYTTSRTSLIGALWWELGISVAALAQRPELDLMDLGVWVSGAVNNQRFGRIACVEMRPEVRRGLTKDGLRDLYDTLFFAVRKCQRKGIQVRSMAMHILGTGDQGIPLQTSLVPLLTEALSALESVEELETIVFFDRTPRRCEVIADHVQRSLPSASAPGGMAFISYSHRDLAIANCIANGLEANGIKPWIDHRMIRNADYAGDIVDGLSQSQAFLVLVSKSSMISNDVLREVRNASAFADKRTLTIWPVLLQKVPYPNEFAYYLTGLDYMDISAPPVEEKAAALCDTLRDRLVARRG